MASSLRPIKFTEHGSTEEQLTQPEYHALLRSELVRITPTKRPDRYRLTANGKVGTVRVGTILLRIDPKVSIDRVLFLASYALKDRGWKEELAELEERRDIVGAIAETLSRQIEKALDGGPLTGFGLREHTSPVLHGRFRETDQLHRHQARPTPLEVTSNELTRDIPENRILRTAAERLLTAPLLLPATRILLSDQSDRLAEAALIERGDPIPLWTPRPDNERYRVALELAELVLNERSVEHGLGQARANGFLFQMWRIFEDFIAVAIREQMGALRAGTVRIQRPLHLGRERSHEAIPDAVWYRSGKAAAVFDAKYKASRKIEHLYQILAYCMLTGARQGHLIYPDAGKKVDMTHHIDEGGVVIHCHSIDLSRANTEILDRVSTICDQAIALDPPQ